MPGCEDCPYGGVKVGSRGPADSPLVIIGDGPSPIEMVHKKAFTGQHKKLIEGMLERGGYKAAGIEPLYINAIECFAKDKKTGRKIIKNKAGKKIGEKEGGKSKYKRALKNCNKRLLEEIGSHPRKQIIALGVGALHAITGNYKLKIGNERGSVIESDLASEGVFVTYHPSTMIAGGGSLKQYTHDFQKAFSLFQGGTFKKYVEPKHITLTNKNQVKALAKMLKKRPGAIIGSDIETGGFNFWEHETLEIGFTWNGKFVFIVPGELITPDLFENECKFLWHNGKFDIRFMWALDCWDARVDHDTMLMSYVLDEVKGIHDLEQVGKDWIGAPDYKGMLKPYLPNKDTSYREIPDDIRRKYAALDIGITYQLYAPLWAKLQEDPVLKKNYEKVLIPASNYLARVEWNGFQTDQKWVQEHKESMEAEMKECQKTFQDLAIASWGKEVNTNSYKQLQKYLYGHLKLGHIDQSTDKDTLESLPSHECLEPLLRIRKIQKYLSTYVYPCIEKIDSDGRIHATYNLNGTVTGRLSSAGPNMQNIPRQPEVRGMFIAPEGRILIECDLSQAELRSLAQLSGDEELCRIFNSDEISLHDEVTAEVFEDYTNPEIGAFEKHEMKMRGKAINFGIVYGRQAFSFVAEFDITLNEAQRWINKWLDRFPDAARFIKGCRNAVMKGQALGTVFGRKRRFGIVTLERRRRLENTASNFPHQSTAADITLIAGTILEPILREKYNALIVNTVHDCLIIECDPEDREEISHLVTTTMEQVPKDWGLLRVPFLAESELGIRWGHLIGSPEFNKQFEEVSNVNTLGDEYSKVLETLESLESS